MCVGVGMDYSIFAPVEKYLRQVVRPRFYHQGYLDAFDFFCIVIWKANRAKSIVAAKLLRLSENKNLNQICKLLTREIYGARKDSEKLGLLLGKWRFRLPMASAILSILYPDKFTIYDVRVCSQIKGFNNLDSLSLHRKCERYFEFMDAVKNFVPEKKTLLEKDKFLWGKSFSQDLKRDIKAQFKKRI